MPQEYIEIVFLVVILAVSIGLHEYAHAITSYSFGDPTPKIQKRLTPNPLAHIDPIGFLMIFLIHFGRGKPVQVNPHYYKNPLRDEFIVAMAGPATNLALAALGMIIMFTYGLITGVEGPILLIRTPDLILSFWILFIQINIALAIFNLLPIPPLDGYRFIKILVPRFGFWLERNSLISFGFLLILLFAPGISTVVRGFIVNTASSVFNVMFVLFGSIFY